MIKASSAIKIFCPGGITSQTGTAVRARHPHAKIEKAGDAVSDVEALLEKNDGPYAIPIWNSHQGAIKPASFIWKRVQNGVVWITDLWAKRIEFWWLRRIGDKSSNKEIGSVSVAEMQCSAFLQKKGLKLIGRTLTTVAYDDYVAGKPWDGVLVADGHFGDKKLFEIIDKTTANPNNFTSFIEFEVARGQKNKARHNHWLTGITMPRLDTSVPEVTRALFTEILMAQKIDDLPKLAFVFDWIDRVGLLFEGPKLLQGDVLDAESLENHEIEVHEEVGCIRTAYNKDLLSLFRSEFQELTSKDFILHEGANTCLFLCPPLGLYTHGFEVATVDPVFRFYIGRLFYLWSTKDMECTTEQKKFFERHRKAWGKNGIDFIKFHNISAAGLAKSITKKH